MKDNDNNRPVSSENKRDNTHADHSLGLGGFIYKILRWCYHSILTLITLSLLSLFLLSAFSDHVSPQSLIYLSYLGIAFPVFLALTVLWAIVLLLLRSWRLFLLMVLVLLIAHEPITRFFPLNVNQEATVDAGESKRLKILTYNTCRLGQNKLSSRKRDLPILNTIKECGADIICLQEYGFSLSKGGYTESYVKKFFSDSYPYYHYLPYYGSKASGIALFSKYPILRADRVDESTHYFSSMHYTLEVDGHKVALINNHLHSNLIKSKDRALYENMMENFESDSIDNIRHNLVRKLGRGYLARAKEVKKVVRVRDNIGAEVPLIICGDFNDTPVSYCYQQIRGALSDSWEEAGWGPGITYNRNKFWFRIDHIFHSNHFKTIDIKVLDEYNYSDHYPVLATVDLLLTP